MARSVKLTVRLTPREHRRLCAEAKRARLGVCTWLRDLGLIAAGVMPKERRA